VRFALLLFAYAVLLATLVGFFVLLRHPPDRDRLLELPLETRLAPVLRSREIRAAGR